MLGGGGQLIIVADPTIVCSQEASPGEQPHRWPVIISDDDDDGDQPLHEVSNYDRSHSTRDHTLQSITH